VLDYSSLRAGIAAEDPDDRRVRLELADLLDSDPGLTDPRGAVLRAACAIHERIEHTMQPAGPDDEPPQNVSLPDRFDAFWTVSPGWEAAARQLEGLAAQPPRHADAFRRRYEHLVRGNVPLDPEHLEPTLRLQYDLQVRLLTSLNLLDRGGITAIDGKRYPLPSFEEVLAKLRLSEVQVKLRQGFDTLLLVPFGLSLDRHLDAWQEGLRRNAATLRGVGQFDENEPLHIWRDYSTQPLVYEPRSFTDRRRGRTKEQLLREDHRGFDVLLVEGSIPNMPFAGQGRRVGGRPQMECGRSPSEYLRSLSDDEVGLTPEAYAAHFLDGLERRGQVLDAQTASYLLGAYLPASRIVPVAYWYQRAGQVSLIGGHPEDGVDIYGARVGVRVA
jgi:hypothetical protein